MNVFRYALISHLHSGWSNGNAMYDRAIQPNFVADQTVCCRWNEKTDFACLEFWRTTSDRDVIHNEDRTGIKNYAPARVMYYTAGM